MAITAPASLLVSPVDEANIGLLTSVGGRITGGAQAANAAGGVDWAGNLVTTGYDLVLGMAYRDALIFDQFATKVPTALTHNGAVVSFPLANDLADDVAGATLNENYDVLPSEFKTAHVEVGMKEYGRVVTRTNLLRGMSMLPFDPVAAERVGRNAVSTIDRIALAAIYAAGGVSASKDPAVFGTPGAVPEAIAPVAGKPTETLNAIAQQFQENDVEPFANGLYVAVITPQEETNLRTEANAAGWRYWQINQEESGGTGAISRRQLGAYENFMFFVSNRLTAGKSIFMGRDGLAKVYPNVPGFGPAPQVEVAPVVDRLRRFYSIGWLWTGGYGRYKAEAIVTSSLPAPA
jgi:N4-gp56 family major capsid protein